MRVLIKPKISAYINNIIDVSLLAKGKQGPPLVRAMSYLKSLLLVP